jgi:hypothetical protein
MESSPAWRRVIFAVVVCLLVALGAYLLGPVAHRDQASGSGSGRHPGHPAAAGSQPVPSVSPAPAASGSGAASRPSATGQDDIYQWLPFTQRELTAAAAIVVRFGDAYGTYSYTQNAAAYAATLQPLASTQLVGQIEAAYAAPGVASTRNGRQQVAVGSATIASIRSFGTGSLTFVVQVSQRLTESHGGSQQVSSYAVTVTQAGAGWQVTDVELAAAGNS